MAMTFTSCHDTGDAELVCPFFDGGLGLVREDKAWRAWRETIFEEGL